MHALYLIYVPIRFTNHILEIRGEDQAEHKYQLSKGKQQKNRTFFCYIYHFLSVSIPV